MVNRVALMAPCAPGALIGSNGALDQQGIRTIADLEAMVPSLRLNGQEGSGIASVSIRGIRLLFLPETNL